MERQPQEFQRTTSAALDRIEACLDVKVEPALQAGLPP